MLFLSPLKPLHFAIFAQLLCLFLVAFAPLSFALGDDNYIDHRYKRGHFIIVGEKSEAQIYVDKNDFSGVQKIAALLRDDIKRVANTELALVHDIDAIDKSAIIIGTLGKSSLIDQIVARGKVDISDIKNAWDGYHLEVVNKPLPGIAQALVIIGSNKRGTMYGALDLSEKIGVSPWHWWADVPVKKHSKLYVTRNTRVQDSPKVKYRGIFLNDEAPALSNWVKEKYGDYNSQFYGNVFELLLRLKANFLWPAMWNNAFNLDDPNNMVLADEMGIVMSTSHHEPMMRADKEWDRQGKGVWEYSKNAENLYPFWEQGAKRNAPYESVYTLGMRGQQDTPMSEGDNAELLERIVRDQRKILSDVFGEQKLNEVPQVWALYKEVQGFYERGMRVPDDVTLLWCDDNWGNIRRLPTPDERRRSGGAGVYYHFDYVGGPRSYRWINSTRIGKVWEQMNQAYSYDAKQIWIVNVGDLKPMEIPTEFFLRMAWNPESWDHQKMSQFYQLWATREFGAEHAAEIAALVDGYSQHNYRRKPELQDPSSYQLLHYAEAERISEQMKTLTARAKALGKTLAPEYQDAYFQLVAHPVEASSLVTELYHAVAVNRLYASQGRALTQQWADRAKTIFAADQALTDRYHNLAKGKWNHMMSQPHIGYSHWNNPPANTLPSLHLYQPHPASEMGVAIEGKAEAWPTAGNYALEEFSPYGKLSRRIEIFNKGEKPFNFIAKASAPWIILSNTSGQVDQQSGIEVSIDWGQLPPGRTSGKVALSGASWGNASIEVNAVKPDTKALNKLSGYIEANGYVAIDAANYQSKKVVQGFDWQVIDYLGRTDQALQVLPITDYSFGNPTKAPFVEYQVFLFNAGEVTVEVQFAPSLSVLPQRGLKAAVGFNKETPQLLDIAPDNSEQAWAQAVSDSVRVVKSRHKIAKPGKQTLRLYMVDPGVVVEKIIINTGGLKPSYLGPPPSQFIK